MKQFLSIALVGVALSVQAQKNTLLEQSFWQGKPTADQVKAEVEKGNSPSQFNPSSFDPVVLAINAQAPNETKLDGLSDYRPVNLPCNASTL